jgi:hypothetical protein
VGVEVDEELGGEERGEEGVDGVEVVRKLEHRGVLCVAGVEHVVVLGRDGVEDEVLPGARTASTGRGVRRADSTHREGSGSGRHLQGWAALDQLSRSITIESSRGEEERGTAIIIVAVKPWHGPER